MPKYTKKFTAIQISPKTVGNTVMVELEYGQITGPYYSVSEPITTFDTEEEAIEWAYEEDQFAEWLIVPKIIFNRD